MAEISDAELATKNRAVALLDRMWNDPKEGLAFKKKVKELVPDANIPELSIIDSATAPFAKLLESEKAARESLEARLNAFETSRQNTAEEKALRKELDQVKKQYSFTDEGMEKVIGRMREKSNPDAEAAAAWVAAQERKVHTSSALMPSALNLYGAKTQDGDWAELNKDPNGWADKEMLKIMNEFADAA